MTADYCVGTSGWVYADWQGIFYPEGLPRTRWFEYYSRSFSTVEINSTFYRLPSEKAIISWRESAPRPDPFCNLRGSKQKW